SPVTVGQGQAGPIDRTKDIGLARAAPSARLEYRLPYLIASNSIRLEQAVGTLPIGTTEKRLGDPACWSPCGSRSHVDQPRPPTWVLEPRPTELLKCPCAGTCFSHASNARKFLGRCG